MNFTSEDTLARRQLVMIDVAPYRHLQATGQSLENPLYLMVLVHALGLDVQVHPRRVAQALEEVEEHLGRHVAHFLATELGIPHQPRPSAEIESHAAQAVVHGQTIAVTLDAALVAQSTQETLSQSQGRILYRVVFVHLQVAFRADIQIHSAMLADLLQHVVEESQSRTDVAPAATVQIQAYLNVGFLGRAAHTGFTFSCKKDFGNAVPTVHVADALVRKGVLVLLLQNQGTATEVQGQLRVRLTVADDPTGRHVVTARSVTSQHGRTRLARGQILFRETAVYQHIVERYALSLQGAHHQIVHRPKSVFRKGIRAQPVLVGHHDKLVIQFLADKCQIAHHARHERQFLERVYLLVRRLFYQSAVAVYKQGFFHDVHFIVSGL